MLTCCKSSRVCRAPARRSPKVMASAAKPSVNAAATSAVPIREVQTDVSSQPTGFLASIMSVFNSTSHEEQHDDHAHNHVMFHSHIAEMLAADVPKPKVSVVVAKKAHGEEPHVHEDHAHNHSMFHSHIANAKAFE